MSENYKPAGLKENGQYNTERAKDADYIVESDNHVSLINLNQSSILIIRMSKTKHGWRNIGTSIIFDNEMEPIVQAIEKMKGRKKDVKP